MWDLQVHCGINLARALEYGSGWSPRQLLVLISRLPIESHYVAARRGGPEYQGWSVERYRLTDTVDLLQQLIYLTLRVNLKNPRSLKPPEPVYRPGSKESRAPTKKSSSPLLQMMEANRARMRAKRK